VNRDRNPKVKDSLIKNPCMRTIKICIHKVWAEEVETKGIVNIPSLILMIPQGIELYNQNCVTWNSVPVEDVMDFANKISKTAESSWLRSKMAGRAKEHNVDDCKKGNFITDMNVAMSKNKKKDETRLK